MSYEDAMYNCLLRRADLLAMDKVEELPFFIDYARKYFLNNIGSGLKLSWC
jgi:hypothetical protein